MAKVQQIVTPLPLVGIFIFRTSAEKSTVLPTFFYQKCDQTRAQRILYGESFSTPTFHIQTCPYCFLNFSFRISYFNIAYNNELVEMYRGEGLMKRELEILKLLLLNPACIPTLKNRCGTWLQNIIFL